VCAHQLSGLQLYLYSRFSFQLLHAMLMVPSGKFVTAQDCVIVQ